MSGEREMEGGDERTAVKGEFTGKGETRRKKKGDGAESVERKCVRFECVRFEMVSAWTCLSLIVLHFSVYRRGFQV